jgi:tetratricopeptide (TPR) repeat protein
MKKILCVLLLSLSLLTCIPLCTVQADTGFWSDHYPYDTYTVDYEGRLTYTQTAYVPLGNLTSAGVLNAPEDLYVTNGKIYVADAGNSRIAVFDYEGNFLSEIGVGLLDNPTGVFVTETGLVYVADKGTRLVYKFDQTGLLVRTFDRPVEPLFGESSLYVPIKVVVGAGENIYVIGDGSTSGVIQLNYDGSFLGYFGVNLSEKSVLQKIAEFFVVTDEYAASTPPSPTNIAINNKSLVYTATPNTETALKKLDVNGNNILTTANYNTDHNVVDLDVDDIGYLYAVYDDGMIVEYDPAGNLLFAFDVTDASSNIIGQIRKPTSIAVDDNRRVFVLDGTANTIVAYAPTDFADLVHQAIGLYNEGKYAESTGLFESILRQNANFALAHAALGKAYYQAGNYPAALKEFKLANAKEGYSETYWKIRDLWLKDNLSWIFIVILALTFLLAILKRVDQKTLAFAGIHGKIRVLSTQPAVRKFTMIGRILKQPNDAFFRIKRLHWATPGSATILVFVLFIEYLALVRFSGYLFNNFSENINLFAEIVKFFGVFFLFVFANYLISTLSDGEGWLKDIYVGTAYALSPLLIGWIPLILISNVLTQNESVVMEIYTAVLYGWTAILIFLSTKEIHNFEIKETFKNLILTLFTVLIIVLIGFIVYAFGSELIHFVVSWVKEVINRVFA